MTVRFAHISDLHLPPLAGGGLRAILNKRLLGYMSWHHKRKRCHRPEVVQALKTSLTEWNADHICITGDITNLGLGGEFQAAGRWLARITTPDTTTFVPGNHDAYTPASIAAMHEHFSRWLPRSFPSITQRGDLLFIGLSSAVATPPLLAIGTIDRQQLRALRAILADAKTWGLFKVLLIHHPPIAGIVGRRKSLSNPQELAEVLDVEPVDLILHGHGHYATHYHLHTARGAIPVFGAGSATLSHEQTARTGHYHGFELDEELRVIHYHYNPSDRRFTETGRATLPRRRPGPG